MARYGVPHRLSNVGCLAEARDFAGEPRSARGRRISWGLRRSEAAAQTVRRTSDPRCTGREIPRTSCRSRPGPTECLRLEPPTRSIETSLCRVAIPAANGLYEDFEGFLCDRGVRRQQLSQGVPPCVEILQTLALVLVHADAEEGTWNPVVPHGKQQGGEDSTRPKRCIYRIQVDIIPSKLMYDLQSAAYVPQAAVRSRATDRNEVGGSYPPVAIVHSSLWRISPGPSDPSR